MKAAKRKKLAAAGWKIGSAEDFLGLTPEEARFVEIKVGLSQTLRHLRERHGLTQGEVATRIGSSQSRIAKAEAADPSVSLDLLVRALIAIGASRREFAKAFGRARSKKEAA